jgi:hypothetical protein
MFKLIKKLKKEKEIKISEERINKLNRAITSFEIHSEIKGDFQEFIKNFRDTSLIMLILGRRGAGKTALGMKLIEAGKILNKNPYVLGFGSSKVPKWIKKADNIEKIPNNSLVLVDEAGISFSSRESMNKSNKFLASLLAIARHKNLSLVFVTQNSGMLDLNVLRLCDILIFKEPSLLQTRFERKGLQDIFGKVSEEFKKIDKEKKNYSYIISDDFEGVIKSGLPEFWNESISKSFSKR